MNLPRHVPAGDSEDFKRHRTDTIDYIIVFKDEIDARMRDKLGRGRKLGLPPREIAMRGAVHQPSRARWPDLDRDLPSHVVGTFQPRMGKRNIGQRIDGTHMRP